MTAGFVCKTKTKHIMGIKFGQIDVRPRKINKERKKTPQDKFPSNIPQYLKSPLISRQI